MTKKLAPVDLHKLGDALDEHVIKGDAPGVVALLLSVDESTRQDLAIRAKAALDTVYEHRRNGLPTGGTDQEKAAQLATFGTAPARELTLVIAMRIPTGCADLVCDLIAARWPEKSAARKSIVRAIHVGDSRLSSMPRSWEYSRQLEKRGIGVVPDDEERVRTFIWGERRHFDLVEAVADDPVGLRLAWYFFDSPSAGGHLLSHDQEPIGRRWDDAIVALSARGTLPRSELLDAVLRAMAQGDRSGIAWFAGLHHKLAPNVDEVAVRIDRYLGLLSSRADAVLVEVHSVMSMLLDVGRLSHHDFVAAVAPALSAKGKKVARSYIDLLERLASVDATLAAETALAATGGLLHAAAELQAAAVRLIERCGDPNNPALLDRINEVSSLLAASTRKHLDAWLGSRAAPPPRNDAADGEERAIRERAAALSPQWRRLAGIDEALAALDAGSATIPPLKLDPLAIPRLGTLLSPISTLDELIDTALVACEGKLGPDDLERVLDGIARLCRLRPQGFEARVGPLRHRAMERLEAADGSQIQDALINLMLLFLAWTEGRGERPIAWDSLRRWENVVERAAARQYPAANVFLSERLRQVARRVARGESGQLLSTPTHAGGFIDPRVVVARAGAATTDVWDQIVALLRLAPEHRTDALALAGGTPGELGSALRYALGGNEPIGKTAALWYAAARARSPLGDDAAVEAQHPDGGPDAGRAARYAIDGAGFPSLERGAFRAAFNKPGGPVSVAPEPRGEVPMDQFPSVWHAPPLHWALTAPTAWESSLWPIIRQPAFRREARELSCFLDSQGLYWKGDWEGLFDPDADFGLPGMMLIALGLSARHPTVSKLAEDALVAAIDDGRLDSARLGEAMAALLRWGEVTLTRWMKALSEVARLTPLHLETLRAAVEHALALAAVEPKRVGPLLECLHQWTIESGEPVSDAARKWLESVCGGGKYAKLAKAILAISQTPASEHRRAVAGRVLSNRIDRAERWQRIALLDNRMEKPRQSLAGG